jgi:hypothetical protein
MVKHVGSFQMSGIASITEKLDLEAYKYNYIIQSPGNVFLYYWLTDHI